MPTVTFTIKLPKTPNFEAVIQEVVRVHQTQVIKDIDAYYNLITGSWSAKNRPKLKHTISRIRGAVTTTVYPQGDIYKYVTAGTKPHPIMPKRARFLRFLWGGPGSYVPKTRPPAQYGGPGKVVNGTMQYRKRVNHPGNEARKFELMIAKEYEPKFARLMQEAVNRGLRIAKQSAK